QPASPPPASSSTFRFDRGASVLNTAAASEAALERRAGESVFDLTGKVALVTGGSRGIGRATAQALGRQGALVVVAYVSGETAEREVVDKIVGGGGKAEPARIDMADAEGSDRAVSEIAKRHGRLDVLVANAGISADALLLRLKDDELMRVLSVN